MAAPRWLDRLLRLAERPAPAGAPEPEPDAEPERDLFPTITFSLSDDVGGLVHVHCSQSVGDLLDRAADPDSLTAAEYLAAKFLFQIGAGSTPAPSN